MFKFHIPYAKHSNFNIRFLEGKLLKNFYGSPTSIDLRIVVGKNAKQAQYNTLDIEQRVFYFNVEEKNKSKYTYPYSIPSYDDYYFNNSFDSVSEVYILYGFLQKLNMPMTLENFTDIRNFLYDFTD